MKASEARILTNAALASNAEVTDAIADIYRQIHLAAQRGEHVMTFVAESYSWDAADSLIYALRSDGFDVRKSGPVFVRW